MAHDAFSNPFVGFQGTQAQATRILINDQLYGTHYRDRNKFRKRKRFQSDRNW